MTSGSPRRRQEKYERGTRSYTMSHIRGKDTSIETMVRSYLFRRGLRFRKNDKRYPGHPDVVLPKYRTIVFVNGCFWHMHENCTKHSMPKSNVEFWTAKLTRNRERDRRQHAQLKADGWRVIDVWECELAKATREERLELLYREIVGRPETGTMATTELTASGDGLVSVTISTLRPAKPLDPELYRHLTS
ncbi:DNA mismatch endonuclease Vsr [Bifidobacterium sp. SMA15]|uniref:DNA mismatch endonuclease Vsr n=1 Tax=Bifidobacterium platyrrhinorum TaxID=2661628 RepID=A0A6L9SY74_9BIFI|nr:DNA mismatch endonuclease Vsr [Bifidobacterium platyrrhinorum]